MSICVALNLIVILVKYEKKRYLDLTIDILALILIMSIFSATNEARAIGTFASMVVSVYLYFKPPKLPKELF
jgi:uncharacterized membrane protein